MSVTDAGTVTSLSATHSRNVESLIFVTVSGMTTFSSWLQQ